jgi:hypothetical protein
MNWFSVKKNNIVFPETIKTRFIMVVKITLYMLVFFILIGIFISEINAPKTWLFLVQITILFFLRTSLYDPKTYHLNTVPLKLDKQSVRSKNHTNEIQSIYLNRNFRSDLLSHNFIF